MLKRIMTLNPMLESGRIIIYEGVQVFILEFIILVSFSVVLSYLQKDRVCVRVFILLS